MSEFYWRNNFALEFCHPVDQFPDFQKEEQETHLEVFKRAFYLYKTLRKLVKEMIHETIRNKCKHLNPNIIQDLEKKTEINFKSLEYLSPFSAAGREVNPIIANTKHVTLEFICFHKNWVDVAHFTNI